MRDKLVHMNGCVFRSECPEVPVFQDPAPACDEWIMGKKYQGLIGSSSSFIAPFNTRDACETRCAQISWCTAYAFEPWILANRYSCTFVAWDNQEPVDAADPSAETYAKCSAYLNCQVGEEAVWNSGNPSCQAINCPDGEILDGDECVAWAPEIPAGFTPVQCENYDGIVDNVFLTHPLETETPACGFCADPNVIDAIQYNNLQRDSLDQYTGPGLGPGQTYEDWKFCEGGESWPETQCVSNPTDALPAVTCDEELSRMAFWWAQQRCMYVPDMNSLTLRC